MVLQEALQLTEQKISDKLISKMSEILESGKLSVYYVIIYASSHVEV